MSKLNPSDLINKATWTLVEGIKDAVAANITSVTKSGQIALKGPDTEKLLAIIAASVEEGYHRGARVFSRTVDAALAPPGVIDGQKSQKQKK